MVQDVYQTIAKYAKLISELEFSLGESVKILYRHDGRCYMTISGADLSELTELDIQDVTDHDEGEMPAADALMGSKDLEAMIISDPPYAGICLESHHEIPAVLDDMAQIAGPKIEIVEADSKAISKALRKASAVMIENSCLIAAGRSLYEAYTTLLVVEKSCEVTLKAQVIGGVKPIKPRLARHMRRVYIKKYSKPEEEYRKSEEISGDPGAAAVSESAAPAFDPKEKELREKLVIYGMTLVSTGLVQGTWGNLSVRLDDKYMLCTPSGIDYDRLRAEDIVKVDINDLSYEGLHKPTSEKSLHAGIYRKYAGAGAIIHTHSKNISIFAAAEMPLQVEDMGKIALTGEIIGISKYALAGTNAITNNVIKAMKDSPGVVISHHGMVSYGKDLEEALKVASSMEEAAGEYIDKRWE